MISSKRQIETRTDIEELLDSFYNTALRDEEIGHHFADLDLEKHLPVISNFWEKVLFGNPVYFGNPLIVHRVLHSKSPLLPEHFERWMEIFVDTVDRDYTGEVANEAKRRARMIADTLSMRLNDTSNPPVGLN